MAEQKQDELRRIDHNGRDGEYLTEERAAEWDYRKRRYEEGAGQRRGGSRAGQNVSRMRSMNNLKSKGD